MENFTASIVLNELTQVHELARKLNNSLHKSSNLEICKTIAMEIIFTAEKAICMAKATGTDCRDQYKDNQQMLKKRKILPTWTGQVIASNLRGSVGLPDDGYTWRKYGQKDILNMKYPRAYYRCTHRKRKGCLAMKQVQRSENDPSLFNVTYKGTHSCSSKIQDNILFDNLNNKDFRMKTETFALEAQDSTSSILIHSTPINPEEDLFCSSTNLESSFPSQKSNKENQNVGLKDAICEENYMKNSTMMDVDLILTTGKMDDYFLSEISEFYEWNSAAYDLLLNS